MLLAIDSLVVVWESAMSRLRVPRIVTYLASVALAFSGCVPPQTLPPPEVRSRLGRIVVVSDPAPPHSEFQTFARGRLEGTFKGGAGGAAVGLTHGLAGAGASGGGPYAGAALVIATVIFTIVGTATGAVIGHRASVPEKTASEIDRLVEEALAGMELSEAVAAQVRTRALSGPELAAHGFSRATYGTPWRTLSKGGADTALVIRVTEAGFAGGAGHRPRIAFYLSARVEVVDAASGEALFSRDFLHASPLRPFDAWFADSARGLAEEFQAATGALAERILDDLLVITAFPFPSGKWALGGPAFSTCWFFPVDPPRELRPVTEFVLHPGSLDPDRDLIRYTVVDSLQPRLSWEPMPRPRDLTEANRAIIARIGDVTYDLRIWEAVEGHPGRIVYDRTGLTEPGHTLEYPLDPGRRYFWTFRARYTLDGVPQVTRWAFSLAPAGPSGSQCDLDAIPPANYYRFATPGTLD